MMLKEQWQKNQDHFYSDPDDHTHLQYDPKSVYAKDLTTHLAEALKFKGSEDILEIGCGAGRFSLHLSPAVKSLTALDMAPNLLERLKQLSNNDPKFKFVCGDAYRLDDVCQPQSLDAVCGFFILHHLLDHPALFKSIGKVLKPGAKIGFIEPNRLNPLFAVQVVVSKEMTWKAEKGMFTFSATATHELLENNGFENVQIGRFGFFPPPILDNLKFTYGLQKQIEKVALFRRFLPFVLITATKR